jgi:hypothetical protein
MAIIDLGGAYDMHIHSAPAPFVRIGDSIDIASWCAEAGMAGLVIKSHFESTISKVHHARRALQDRFPDFKIFSAIALNRGCGGVNPRAVEMALALGAKVVWLPTLDAEGHAKGFGQSGTYGFRAMTLDFKPPRTPPANAPITVLEDEKLYTVTENGVLTNETKRVIELVRDYGAILGTGHISRDEIFAVYDYCVAAGLDRVVVTHPEFRTPNLDIKAIEDLAEAGAYMEFCAVDCFPIHAVKTVEEIRDMILAAGINRSILSSDAGQPWAARPPETLRIFLQCLHEKGMAPEQLRTMVTDNPELLLGIERKAETAALGPNVERIHA